MNGKVYTGYEAVRENREITKEFTGPLDDETAEQIIEKYGFPSQVEEYCGGFRDENYLNGFVTEYLGNGYMRSWDDYKVSTELIPVAQTDLGRAAETSGKEIILCYTKGWSVLLDSVYERGGERQRCDGKDRSGIYPDSSCVRGGGAECVPFCGSRVRAGRRKLYDWDCGRFSESL